MSRTKLSTLIYFIIFYSFFAQNNSIKRAEYLCAVEKLKIRDTSSAISLLKESIRQNDDAQSHFELAKIYWNQKDYLLRNEAFENMKMAIMKDEKNIEYKYFYADICQYFARFEAVNQWKEILAMDSTQIKALINLAEFSSKEFDEWNKSYRRTSIGLFSLQKWADEDFNNSIKYYKQALKIDSLNYELCIKISLFFAKNNLSELGIPHLKRLEQAKKADMNVYECLGLLYYKTHNLKESYNSFLKAISLMNEQEKKDFEISSIKYLIQDSIPILKNMSDDEIEILIASYWKTNDPFLMTEYNERLLEHYSRVAYANLNFSIPRMNIIGWKSNRGEIILRYGEPLSRIRIRPSMGFTLNGNQDTQTKNISIRGDIKSDIWNYSDFTLVFEDEWFNSNYRFSNSQLLFIEDLLKSKPIIYYPKFEGPIFDLPNQTYQFASKNKAQTDIYLSYKVDYSDTSIARDKFSEGYNVGWFVLDRNFNKILENQKAISNINSSADFFISSLQLTGVPQSCNLAFELIRKKDKGVTAYHGKYNIKSFFGNDLKISDIVLAYQVETDKMIDGSIKRNNISILPNPTKIFKRDDKLFLYYEIYNLAKNTNYLTDFEQKITIQKKKENGAINSLLSVVGLDKEGDKITLTSNYQMQEKDPQMYLQLDMNKYEAGEYIITVTVKDKTTGKEVSYQTEIYWQNK